ncbi:MAG: TAXI family TRAP transporter solute-binding subunit [Rhizobiales bacterium]|nr:TAXI family TRAP transporter solute-binding subunit [Hyphomicrobiales bacterium]
MLTLNRRSLAAGLVAGLVLAPAAAALAQTKRVTIGTNPAGSIYYALGGGLAKVFTEKMDVQAIVQPYAGSSVYLPLVNNGEVTTGLSSTLDSGAAYNGADGRKPMKDMRSLVRIFSLPYTFMVRADSELKTVADLKGKKVVMVFKALRGLQPMNEAMILAGGLKLSEITPITVAGLKQGLDAVADKTADATAIAAGIAMVKEVHASIPGGIRYLNITGSNASDDFMEKTLAGSALMELKPNPRMPEVTEPINIGTYHVYLIAGAKLSNADAEKMTNVLIDNWPALQKDYPALRAAKLDDLSLPANVLPYHPGAVAAFKARNMWLQKNNMAEAKFK